jgi:peptidoglycan/xylan/chitin deacetylase (PgdA/CDA1 family)
MSPLRVQPSPSHDPWQNRPVRAIVLTYHSNNVLGRGYADNDHVALAEDLALLAQLRLPVVPLGQLVDALDGGKQPPPRAVALSFDDGSWFDWHDLPHPSFGTQRSFANILADAEQLAGKDKAPLHATSFVIASPAAREALDRSCLVGQGWWGDEWWSKAQASGRMAIENHSWDHHHDAIPSRVTGLPGGDFHSITSHHAADLEIRQASDFLDSRLPTRRTRLFAYPYGHCNPYLREEYLPHFRHEHRLDAAFDTTPEPLTRHSNRWKLGRYVCGQHWNSTEALERLLREVLGR